MVKPIEPLHDCVQIAQKLLARFVPFVKLRIFLGFWLVSSAVSAF